MKKAESGEPAELVPHVLAELLRVEADRLFLLVPKEDIPIMIWDRVRYALFPTNTLGLSIFFLKTRLCLGRADFSAHDYRSSQIES